LTLWQPQAWPVAQGWQACVEDFFASATGQRLGQFVQQRLDAGAVVFPPQPLRALALTPLDAVRVVILGQDPYHGAGQAEGLAFSVAAGEKIPPSLRNIFKELQRDLSVPPPASGSLVRWADQGVLLLNTSLTVEEGLPASHARQGWEVLTDGLLELVLQSGQPLVFLLWGAHAQGKRALIEASPFGARHLVLAANHPSPLSAARPPVPFLGCGHFSKANAFLASLGGCELAW
jgi:uracil-DNA glycosylase